MKRETFMKGTLFYLRVYLKLSPTTHPGNGPMESYLMSLRGLSVSNLFHWWTIVTDLTHLNPHQAQVRGVPSCRPLPTLTQELADVSEWLSGQLNLTTLPSQVEADVGLMWGDRAADRSWTFRGATRAVSFPESWSTRCFMPWGHGMSNPGPTGEEEVPYSSQRYWE